MLIYYSNFCTCRKDQNIKLFPISVIDVKSKVNCMLQVKILLKNWVVCFSDIHLGQMSFVSFMKLKIIKCLMRSTSISRYRYQHITIYICAMSNWFDLSMMHKVKLYYSEIVYNIVCLSYLSFTSIWSLLRF